MLKEIKLVSTGFTFLVFYTAAFLIFGMHYFINGDMSMGQTLIRMCIIAPVWEELAFRYVPQKLFGNLNRTATIIGSSVFFGYIHGGVPNIFIQGVAGVVLSLVYIYSGYKLWTNILLHAMWNFFLAVIIPIYVLA